jgi:hypothetical protein
MALPRKILNALRAGTYTPSSASKRAREAANRLREQREHRPTGGSNLERDVFVSRRDRVIQKKHNAFYGVKFYDPIASIEAVNESTDDDAIEQALSMTREEMFEYASRAAKAHAAIARTGSAGDMEIYLRYDFLFYHL